MSEEVKLGCEQFLDMLQMFAVDHADPATLANPPATIYCALTRQGTAPLVALATGYSCADGLARVM